ncbi:hypothetical protein [Vibrio casei]|uniref:hypothetical protein n=1 Tax=Vibrio casei TaxID=673372 RepID=UPI003F9567C8
MTELKLTEKQEAFCQAIAKYGDKAKVRAFEEAGYSVRGSKASVGVAADKTYNLTNVQLRIRELRKIVMDKIEEDFKYTIEWRLKKLEDVIEAGLETYTDAQGNARREALSASKGAIDTMNAMLGTSDDNSKERKSFNVTLRVEDASVPE